MEVSGKPRQWVLHILLAIAMRAPTCCKTLRMIGPLRVTENDCVSQGVCDANLYPCLLHTFWNFMYRLVTSRWNMKAGDFGSAAMFPGATTGPMGCPRRMPWCFGLRWHGSPVWCWAAWSPASGSTTSVWPSSHEGVSPKIVQLFGCDWATKSWFGFLVSAFFPFTGGTAKTGSDKSTSFAWGLFTSTKGPINRSR